MFSSNPFEVLECEEGDANEDDVGYDDNVEGY